MDYPGGIGATRASGLESLPVGAGLRRRRSRRFPSPGLLLCRSSRGPKSLRVSLGADFSPAGARPVPNPARPLLLLVGATAYKTRGRGRCCCRAGRDRCHWFRAGSSRDTLRNAPETFVAIVGASRGSPSSSTSSGSIVAARIPPLPSQFTSRAPVGNDEACVPPLPKGSGYSSGALIDAGRSSWAAEPTAQPRVETIPATASPMSTSPAATTNTVPMPAAA